MQSACGATSRTLSLGKFAEVEIVAPLAFGFRRVQKLLSLMTQTLKWRLMDRQRLETWVHGSGRVLLLGDSCHPMLVGTMRSHAHYRCADDPIPPSHSRTTHRVQRWR